MNWVSGQPWRVANALNKLNTQIREYAPGSVPPATDLKSWGSIADDAHSQGSDHYPHYIPALGGTAVVLARDFPHAPALGLDGGVVTEHMRQAHDPRVQYIIFNRRITGVNYGWTWHTYTGTDPHDTHFHVSLVHTALADSNAPWNLPSVYLTPTQTGLTIYQEEPMLITIPESGSVSITLPLNLPATARIDFCNDTVGQRYALRMMYTIGNGVWSPLPGCGEFIFLDNGQAWGLMLPADATGLTLRRAHGGEFAPAREIPVYTGPLTAAIG